MGLNLSKPELNKALQDEQNRLLQDSFMNSEFLKNANNNNYNLISEEDLKNFMVLIDGSKYALIFHSKKPDQKVLLETPIGKHLIKLGFYTLLMTSTNNDDLISLMNEQYIRHSWVSTQGFVLPSVLVNGITESNFIVQKSIRDRNILELDEDPYNVLNESIQLIDAKLNNLVKKTTNYKTDINIPRNKNLLQIWNNVFIDIEHNREITNNEDREDNNEDNDNTNQNEVDEIKTYKFKFKHDKSILEYFPFIKSFLQYIYKNDIESYNKVVKNILELKNIDVKYLNLSKEEDHSKAENRRQLIVNKELDFNELEKTLSEPIELIQYTTKSNKNNFLERLLYNVPDVNTTQGSKYNTFRILQEELDKLNKTIDSQISIIQQDMVKNYVDCYKNPNNNVVFNEPKSRNLCKAYNEITLGNEGLNKIHRDTAIAFAEVLNMVLKTQKKILILSYEFLLEYRTDISSIKIGDNNDNNDNNVNNEITRDNIEKDEDKQQIRQDRQYFQQDNELDNDIGRDFENRDFNRNINFNIGRDFENRDFNRQYDFVRPREIRRPRIYRQSPYGLDFEERGLGNNF
jgi:hypothetical protein